MSKDNYSQARTVMVRPEFFENPKWQDQKIRADRYGAHPQILEFERKFVAKMRSIGIPMFAHCVVRTRDKQRKLFAAGHSKAVAGQSPHNFGMAVDLIHSTMAWDLPSRKCWDLIGQIGKDVAHSAQIKIHWGGDFKSLYDPAHWELQGWRDIADF